MGNQTAGTLALLIFVSLGGLPAQTLESPCEPAPEVQREWAGWDDWDDAVTPYQARYQRRMAEVERLLESHPKDLKVHSWRQQLLQGPMRTTPEAALNEYEQLLASDPESPELAYLLASLLAGRDSKRAIGLLDSVLEKDPGFAPAHILLARIYQYPAYKDEDQSLDHLAAYRKACPGHTDDFAAAPSKDPVYVERSLPLLRRILEQSEDPLVLRRYETLWSWEFSSRPANIHDRARELVAKDVTRLESLGLDDSFHVLRTIESGYGLLGDEANQRAMDLRIREHFPDSMEAQRRSERDNWRSDPYPRDGNAASIEAWSRRRAEAAEEWVAKWPNSPGTWATKLSAMKNFSAPDPDEIAATADRLLEAYRLQPDHFRAFPPIYYQIAEAYLKAGVRLDRIAGLVKLGDAELEQDRDRRSASDYAPPGSRRPEGNWIGRYQIGAPLLVVADIRLQRFDRARETLHELEAWINERRPAADEPEEALDFNRGLLLELRGRLAEAEGRRPDAVALYLTAARLRTPPTVPRSFQVDTLARAKSLWSEMGGTREGLQSLEAAAGGETNPDNARWSEENKKLPELEITDTSGKTWRRSDFLGKKTFVNLWATWCGFCMPELPVVQKMHEDLREREDIQIVTFNLDENPGVIQPFLDHNGYKFTVLPMARLADELFPLVSLPRNWLVDREGVVRYEQKGYNHEQPPEEWLRGQGLSLLNALK
jgi:thiol-disulfide isomerase/thioredoxin